LIDDSSICFRYALVLIAMFNVFDLIGRYIPVMKILKMESRKLITTAVISRFLLIPAFYFTAKYGKQGWMIFLTSFLGLSNGYLTICVFTSAPKGYKVSLLRNYRNVLDISKNCWNINSLILVCS
jgi:hypothetical protein